MLDIRGCAVCGLDHDGVPFHILPRADTPDEYFRAWVGRPECCPDPAGPSIFTGIKAKDLMVSLTPKGKRVVEINQEAIAADVPDDEREAWVKERVAAEFPPAQPEVES